MAHCPHSLALQEGRGHRDEKNRIWVACVPKMGGVWGLGCTALYRIVVIYFNNAVTQLLITWAPFVTMITHKTDLETIGTKESLILHLKRR